MSTWWAISSGTFIEALRRAAAGEDADILYAEYYANSDVENVPPHRGRVRRHGQHE